MNQKAGWIVACLGILAGRADAGDHDLVVKSATIKSTKANGESWDFFGNAPDPYVKVGKYDSDGKLTIVQQTDDVGDDYRPSFNKKLFAVREGDDLIIQVWDKDVAKHDLIGEYRLTVTRRMIEDGSARFSFDQVEDLRIDFKPAK